MDPSPAKRRKTSPSTAVAANASNTTFRPVSQDGEQTTPSRASFMSPTKASLARFNPSLLPRPKVAAAGAPRLGQTPFEQQPSRIARKGRTGNGSARRSQPTTPTRELGGLEKTEATTTNARAATASPGRTTRSLGGGMFGAPRRRSHTPGRASLVVKAISANPEVNVVASPPEATDTAQDIVDGQLEQELQDGAARRLGRVANAEEAMDNSDKADPEEPELPPTPTELGLEPQPERPKGLLFSSPSRRARKKKGTSVKSSPLKPRDPPPEKPPESVPIAPMKAAPLQQTKMPDVDEELTSKQKERDKLSRQLQSLRADVARLEGEVARTQETAHVDPRSQVEVDELLYGSLYTLLTFPGLVLTCFAQVYSDHHKSLAQRDSSQASTASAIPPSFALPSLFQAASSGSIQSPCVKLTLTLSPPRTTTRSSTSSPPLHAAHYHFDQRSSAVHSAKCSLAPTPRHHTHIPSRSVDHEIIPYSKRDHRNRRESQRDQPLAVGYSRIRALDTQTSSGR